MSARPGCADVLNTLRRVDGNGTITSLATAVRLNHPFGVAAGKNGQVLVADTYNNRILLLSP